MFHEARTAVRIDDGRVLDDGVVVVDEGIEEELVVVVEDGVGIHELAEEDEVGTRVGIFLLLVEIGIEDLLSLVVVEILVRGGERVLEGLDPLVGDGYRTLELACLGSERREIALGTRVAVLELIEEALEHGFAIGRGVEEFWDVGLEDIEVFARRDHIGRDELPASDPLIREHLRYGHDLCVECDGRVLFLFFLHPDIERYRDSGRSEIVHPHALKTGVIPLRRGTSAERRGVRKNEVYEEGKKNPEEQDLFRKILDF